MQPHQLSDAMKAQFGSGASNAATQFFSIFWLIFQENFQFFPDPSAPFAQLFSNAQFFQMPQQQTMPQVQHQLQQSTSSQPSHQINSMQNVQQQVLFGIFMALFHKSYLFSSPLSNTNSTWIRRSLVNQCKCNTSPYVSQSKRSPC